MPRNIGPFTTNPHVGVRRPNWPFAINRKCSRAAGLADWWPNFPVNSATVLEMVNGVNGTINAAIVDSDETFLSVLRYSGSPQHVSVPSNVSFNFAFNQVFSVACWVKWAASNINGTEIVQAWNNGAGGYSFTLRVGANNVPAFTRYDGTNFPQIFGPVSLNDGQWHRLMGVKDGSILRLYVDGVQANFGTDTTTGVTTNNLPLQFGRRGDGSNYFNGWITDVMVWNRTLAPGEAWQDFDPRTRWDLYYPLQQRVWSFPLPPATGFNADRVQNGVVVGGGCF